MRFGAAIALLAQLGKATAAVPAMRGGDHDGYGRLVLQMSGDWSYQLGQGADGATITLSQPVDLASDAHPPRNFSSVVGDKGRLHLVLAAGARLRVERIGDRLVMDAVSADLSAKVRPEIPVLKKSNSSKVHSLSIAAITPAAAVSVTPEIEQSPVPSPLGQAANPVSVQINPLPAEGSVNEGSDRIAVTRSDMPAGISGNAILVPFEANVGAAAFPRGNHEIIVFDEASPLDLAQIVDDPVFGAGGVTVLEDATVLRLPLPSNGAVRLMRVDAGWLIMFEDQASVNAAIEPAGSNGQLFMPAADALKSVTIQDDLTGENLLIGTQKNPGQAILVARREPEYQLLPSDMGVVIEPVSDRLQLIVQQDGFRLGAGGAGPDLNLPEVSSARMADAAHLTRHYDFQNLPVADLFRQLQSETVAAALSPPLSRFEPRYDVAQTMVALGLDAEAEAVSDLAIRSDPSEADNFDAKGLQGIAATLAGRLDESQGLDDLRLDGWDDVKLWRAVRDASRDPNSSAAAKQFSAAAPLILTYPDALQRKIGPLAVENMALGGQVDAAAALAAKLSDGSRLVLGRAIIDEKRGNLDHALAAYDSLETSNDRDVRALAADRAVELRLAAGKLNAAAAATALEHQFLNWRGDGRELALRERASQLRAQAGDWRNCLALLREAEVIYPDNIAELRDLMATHLEEMLRANGAAAVAPLDLVALADENADLLAQSKQGADLGGILADKLIALDLPARAAPVLQKLMASAGPGESQARLGAKLAEVQLDQNNAQAALDAIAASNVDGISDDLTTERMMATARAQAMLGKSDAATQTLAQNNDPKALDLRARIDEDSKSWADAEAALNDLATQQLPATGNLSDADRNLVVRLAGDASQAGDAARLQSLATMTARMGNDDRANMFKLLTAAPVKQVSDLARANKEDQLVGSVAPAVDKLR